MAWSLVGRMSRSSSRLLVMVSPHENSDVPDDAALMRVSYPRRDGAPVGDPCEKKQWWNESLGRRRRRGHERDAVRKGGQVASLPYPGRAMSLWPAVHEPPV